MLKKLQRKFVLLTTTISVVVMLLIAVLINVANYASIMGGADAVLNLLVQGDLKMGEPFAGHEPFPKEIAFTTRFFTVRSDVNDEIDHIDTRNISSVSVEEAVAYATLVNESENNSGTVASFRYVKVENERGYAYFFLDIEADLIGFQTYLYYSVWILLGAILSIVLLSVLLSKKAVAPIADSYERQKGFITNVSHEFKTPLAIIKADCDVLELDHGDSEWTDSIKMQINRMDTLVENLLSLSRLDEKIDLIKADFSLSDAVTDTVNEFSASMKRDALQLALAIKPNLTYHGDETLIRKLIAILMENAMKYAVPQTVLSISLHTFGGKKVLVLQNACAEVAVGKHNDWFERFYRGDESRNSATKGFGIGLSIAKNICKLHGAKISAESKTGKEITMTIVF